MVSEYTFKARVLPAVLSALPVILFCNSVFDYQVREWLNSADYSALFGKGTLAIAIVYLLSQTNRFIAVWVFERLISKDETHFPTTRLLMPGNAELSDAMREAIIAKTQKTLGMQLPTVVPQGEEAKVRREIADIVRRMRERTRGHKLLLQHNIEYGFARNLIGAGPVVVLVAIANWFLHSQGFLPAWAYKASLGYAVVALILMLLSRAILERYGILYARVLFAAYLDAK